MSEEARHVLSGSPPAGALERILARRADGERAILPVADPPLRTSKLGPVLAIAAMTAVAAGAVFSLTSVRELSAERSELRFFPAEPGRGEEISVEYRATSAFVGESVLVLRGRYRSPSDPAYNRGLRQVTVGQLRREDDGVFRGAFSLPDRAVYGAFAVEDHSGRRVDSNGHALWELLMHIDGRPELAALVQKQSDLIGRNWQVAYETARLAKELYPDSPEAWGRLVAYEAAIFKGEAADSLRAGHRTTFAVLADRISQTRTLSGDDLGWLYWFARRGVQDPALTAAWRGRLLEEASAHPLAVQGRTRDLVRGHAANPAELLKRLEGLWTEVGPAHPQLPLQGYQTARDLGDPDMILRWAERRLAVEPWVAAELAEDFTKVAGLSALGMERLRQELSRLDREGDTRRALHHTVERHQIREDAQRGRMLAAVGRVLTQAGRITGGLDTLDLAAAAGWDVDVHRTIADTKLALGDTTGALEMLSRVAVDPGTDAVFLDSIGVFAANVAGDEWGSYLAGARAEMRQRVLGAAMSRPVAEDLTVVDSAGRRRALGELIDGRVTMVAAWSPHCPPCLAELSRLREMIHRIQGHGARAIGMVTEPPPPSVSLREPLQEAELGAPTFYDIAGAVHRGLGSSRMPNYLVLDRMGRVRFDDIALSEVLRVVAVLVAQDDILVAGGASSIADGQRPVQ
jgi:hypothetical protein